MIAAATVWAMQSTTRVAVLAYEVMDGRKETSVRAHVVSTKVARGRGGQRPISQASTTPTAEKKTVRVAKPETGISSPAMVSGTSAADAIAATVAVAAAARTVARR